MSDKDTTESRIASRRKFLGVAGASALALGVPGVAAARNDSTPEESGSASGSTRIAEDTAMSKGDVRRAYGHLKATYGPDVAYQTFPEWAQNNDRDVATTDDGVSTSTSSSQDGLLQGVTRVDSWEHHYDVRSSTNLLLAETDHYINLYQSDSLDGDGKYVYFWKTLDYSNAVDKGWYACTTDHMTSDLKCTTTALDVVQGKPERKEEFGSTSEYFEINVGPATVGSNFGGSKGYEQPMSGRLDFGYGGRYAYEVGGRIPDLTTGSMIVDTRSNGAWGFDWDTTVKASTGY